jgi:hypothetical protein
MTTQRTYFQNPKSIAGAALLALSLLVLVGNLDGDASQWNCALTTPNAETLGVFPSVVLSAVSQALEFFFFDPQRFSRDFFQTLVSFWLLLFVVVGALLFRAAFTPKV